MWVEFVQKFLLYGCIGILIEFFFTAFANLVNRNWLLAGHSYLWMFPIYSFTAIVLEQLSSALPWPFWIKAFVYVPVIYGIEALSGYTIYRIIGEIPWKYPRSKWNPGALIRLAYSPFWLLLAMCFDMISSILKKIVGFLGTS